MNPLDVVTLTPLMERTSGRREIVIGLLDGPVAATHPELVEANLRELPSAAPQEFLCNWVSSWYTGAMKPPIFSRPLTNDERLQLEAVRRTADAFRVRRAQIVLASAR